MQKSTSNRIVVVLVALVMGVWQALAQEPERLEAVLRFDRAQRDTVAEATAAALPAVADTSSRIACKLNRRRTGFVEAYDAVTLWNVRRVKVKQRRMRLSDTSGHERVRLLKFFTERNRRKGVRPHLVGNAAGYTWTGGGESPDPRTGEWRTEPSRINTYSLRADYDSPRRVGGDGAGSWRPGGSWGGAAAGAVSGASRARGFSPPKSSPALRAICSPRAYMWLAKLQAKTAARWIFARRAESARITVCESCRAKASSSG